MPTYVYECRTCTKVTEVEQRITEAPKTDCDCGAAGSLKRLIQPTAVMFKGSGFHINDYAAKAPESTPPETPAQPKCDAPSADGSCVCKSSESQNP